MTKMHKLLATGIGAALVLSLGGAALASSSKTVIKTGSETTTAVDTDNVQEGDQTGPEVADATEEPTGAGEAAGESDGPGGHEDPPGNVDHQFEGNE
jgi:hypothetical protein